MQNRNIIKIDQEKCTGCGHCVSACAEGAIALVDGKATLLHESYCDGLGVCLGECPQGAITMEEREASSSHESAQSNRQGEKPSSQSRHPVGASTPSTPAGAHRAGSSSSPALACGCPGTAVRTLSPPLAAKTATTRANHGQPGEAAHQPGSPPAPPTTNIPVGPNHLSGLSQLGQWPVQLRLVPPSAPYLQSAHLLICADCVPFAMPDFHHRYLTGRAVVVGCPKLDNLEQARDKLRRILEEAHPASITVLRMEVPCCAGIAQAALDARDEAAPHLPVEVHTIGIQGDIHIHVVPGGQPASTSISQPAPCRAFGA